MKQTIIFSIAGLLIGLIVGIIGANLIRSNIFGAGTITKPITCPVCPKCFLNLPVRTSTPARVSTTTPINFKLQIQNLRRQLNITNK